MNISSSASLLPIAELTVYSATKVPKFIIAIKLYSCPCQIFVDYFSDGLRKEYCSKSIVVQVSFVLGMLELTVTCNNIFLIECEPIYGSHRDEWSQQAIFHGAQPCYFC